MLICVPFSEVTYIDFKDGLMFFVNRTINARPLLPIVLFCADILAGSGSGVVVSLKDALGVEL